MADKAERARLLAEADTVLVRTGALDQARQVRALAAELDATKKERDEWREEHEALAVVEHGHRQRAVAAEKRTAELEGLLEDVGKWIAAWCGPSSVIQSIEAALAAAGSAEPVDTSATVTP